MLPRSSSRAPSAKVRLNILYQAFTAGCSEVGPVHHDPKGSGVLQCQPPLRAELVLNALNMTLYTQPSCSRSEIHRSGGGIQYTSVEFGDGLKEALLLPTMWCRGISHDTNMSESFISTVRRES